MKSPQVMSQHVIWGWYDPKTSQAQLDGYSGACKNWNGVWGRLRGRKLSTFFCENSCPLQGSFGPFGPKVEKGVRKWVPGAERPQGPKSRKRRPKRAKIDCFFNYFDSFSTPFSTFWALRPRSTFFSNFPGSPRDIPAKILGYPTRKFGVPGFRRTYRTFWPPTLHVEDPHPTRRYPDQTVWVRLPFFFPERMPRSGNQWRKAPFHWMRARLPVNW